jgi:hypothetical protein
VILRSALIALVLTSSAVVLADPPSAHQETPWQPLFNGTTLEGWIQRGGKAKYEVAEGAIVGASVPDTANSFLCTTREFSDFLLELEFKVHAKLNSGVQIRSHSLESFQNGRVHGYQVEIDPSDRAWSAGIYDEGRRGWLQSLENNEAARKAFRQNQWNRIRVEAIGDSIKTWINDVHAAALVDSMTPTGFIALQVHATGEQEPMEVRWRNIRIKDLSAAQTDGPSRPAGAIALLDERGDLSEWRHLDRPDDHIRWDHQSGVVRVVPGTGDLVTRRSFEDVRLHVEFNANDNPKQPWQNNGNSGVYIQRRYEIQILNSHGREPTNSDCGAVYAAKAPDFNASKPAGQWQSFDITFHAPRWDATGKKTQNARVTVLHNGTRIHDDVEIADKTGAGQPEGRDAGPILLQDHGNSVRFRNMWVEPLGRVPGGKQAGQPTQKQEPAP